MDFNVGKRRVVKSQDSENQISFNVNDNVILDKASVASMNLYDKAKSAGIQGIHCPCSIHNTDRLVVIKKFANGYILMSKVTGFITAAMAKDLRRI